MQVAGEPRDRLKRALWQGAVAGGFLLIWLVWRCGLLPDIGVAGVVATVLTATGIFRTNRAAYILTILLAVAVAELARRH